MPSTSRTPAAARGLQKRAMYARSTGNMLVNEPQYVWMGLDSGAGRYPIGPNGPYPYTSGAESQAVVARATSLIVDPITSSPFKVQATGATGAPVESPRWLADPMLLRTDGRFTSESIYPDVLKLPRSQFWAGWVRSALWYGIGAFICQEDASGQPLAGTLRLVNPGYLATERSASGDLRWVINPAANSPGDPDRVVFDRDGYVSLGPVTYRLVTLRNPHSPVDPEGMSLGVFGMHPETFYLSSQLDGYASSTFHNGVPSGVLKILTPNPSQEVVSGLKNSWMAAHGGDRRSVAVLSSTVDFQPLSISPVDAALAEQKKLSIADVAYAFAIDPAMLGATVSTSMTYANLRDYFRQHSLLGLGSWTASVQDVLSALLPGTVGVKVNFDVLTRADDAERYAAYKVAIDAGILSEDEVREMEGREPLPKPEPAPQPPELQAVPAPEAPAATRSQPWRGVLS